MCFKLETQVFQVVLKSAQTIWHIVPESWDKKVGSLLQLAILNKIFYLLQCQRLLQMASMTVKCHLTEAHEKPINLLLIIMFSESLVRDV